MKTRVLITGVAGFIGSNLAKRLISDGNYDVIGIDNLSHGVIDQIPKGVKFHKMDIRNKEIFMLFRNIDYVFHFAAKNCISDCQLDPVETIDINVNGTMNVFEASKLGNVKKVIYAESSAMYEGSTIYPTPEYDVKPESFYALSKMCAMHLSEGYSKFSKLKFTALRYFCVYGPGQDYRRSIPPLFSSFILNLLYKKTPTIYGTGEKRRDFIHVDDINDFHIQCMTDDRTTGKVFNLGSGINYSVNEIYSIITDLIGIYTTPKYEKDLPGEAFQNLADITEASNLGWSPKIGLKEGLKTSVEFIKNRIKENPFFLI